MVPKDEWTRGCSMAHFCDRRADPQHGTRRLLRRARSDGCTGRGPRPSTKSHGAIDGAIRSGERVAAEILATA